VPRHRKMLAGALGATLVAALALTVNPSLASAAGGLVVNDLDHGSTALGLAQSLAGPGVAISNVAFTGTNNAAGTFSGGTGIVGFDSGLVLGTGSVQTQPNAGLCAKGVEGPNTCDGNTTNNSAPGDTDLNTLSGVQTYDAAVLQFDFTPAANKIQFSYVFSSDEYPEYANSSYNDTFAFLVNGQNCALVPNTNLPVSVNTINGGNPLGTNPQNSQFYVDNHFVDSATPSALNTEMDGLTTVLTCSADVTAGQTNHMKLAIADGSDSVLDSNVFLKADSLTSGTQIATSLSGGSQSGKSITVPAGTAVSDTATLTGTNISTAGGTVGYTQYTNSTCTDGATSAGTKTVTNGVVPASDALTPTAGTYYWQASYSGDASNNAVISGCDEVLTVTPVAANQPPTGSTGGPYTGIEGSATSITGTASDPDAGDVLSTTWSATSLSGTDPGAACTFGDVHALSTTVTCNDNGVFTLKLAINDGHNPPVEVSTTLTVANANPVVTITSPSDLSIVGIGTSVPLSASFTDAGSNDTQVCSIDWGDTSVTAGVVSGKTCTGSHSYTAIGTYPVTVTVTDDNGGIGTASITLVINDAATKVTGGGFITDGGRTSFGFVATSQPDASLLGQLQVTTPGKNRFHGATVSTLNVSGKTANWTGTGSWNGTSGYTFTVSVVDNGQGGKNKTPDTITITIRNAAHVVVFTTSGALKGGNIVVHS